MKINIANFNVKLDPTTFVTETVSLDLRGFDGDSGESATASVTLNADNTDGKITTMTNPELVAAAFKRAEAFFNTDTTATAPTSDTAVTGGTSGVAGDTTTEAAK